MDSKLKDNKSFTYYPRGRVEIKNLEVAVYLNPNLLRDNVKEFINKTFELSNPSIKKVNYICQYSDHYKCHLDSDYHM